MSLTYGTDGASRTKIKKLKLVRGYTCVHGRGCQSLTKFLSSFWKILRMHEERRKLQFCQIKSMNAFFLIWVFPKLPFNHSLNIHIGIGIYTLNMIVNKAVIQLHFKYGLYGHLIRVVTKLSQSSQCKRYFIWKFYTTLKSKVNWREFLLPGNMSKVQIENTVHRVHAQYTLYLFEQRGRRIEGCPERRLCILSSLPIGLLSCELLSSSAPGI